MQQSYQDFMLLDVAGDRPRVPLLAATFNGRRRALTRAALLRSLFSLPLLILKIGERNDYTGLALPTRGVAHLSKCALVQ